MLTIINKEWPINNISLSNKMHVEVKLPRKKMLSSDSFYRSYNHQKYCIEVVHPSSTKSSVLRQKGRILKRVFQEYKACQIFRKTNISYPLIRTGGKKCSLFGKFDVFCFLETPVLRFALLPYYRRSVFHPNCNKVSHSCCVFIFKLAHDCVLFNEVKRNSCTCLRKSQKALNINCNNKDLHLSIEISGRDTSQ